MMQMIRLTKDIAFPLYAVCYTLPSDKYTSYPYHMLFHLCRSVGIYVFLQHWRGESEAWSDPCVSL